ncbi:DUF1472 domain-containing protein (plasmid) [Klebsiella pneumoniae]|nr:DUF1472 domain-containing protein [Klebsiella pneumoniae]
MMLAVLPVVFSLRFRSKTVQISFVLFLRCGPPVSPLHLPLSAGLSCRHGTTRCRNLMNLWRLLCIMPVKPC